MALRSRGHEVELYTAHHDPSHCFAETKDGSLKVYCAGDWLPRNFLGKGYAFFAYLRMIYVAFYLVFFGMRHCDVIFCDLISACIPVLYCSRAKIIFYCHFPDQLLTKRTTLSKSLYRWPIDALEEWTTGLADIVLVNSEFTAGVIFLAEGFSTISLSNEVGSHRYPVFQEHASTISSITGFFMYIASRGHIPKCSSGGINQRCTTVQQSYFLLVAKRAQKRDTLLNSEFLCQLHQFSIVLFVL